jgi:hypothetical protein
VIDGKEEQIFDRIDALLRDEDYKSTGTTAFSTRRAKERMNRALTVFTEV